MMIQFNVRVAKAKGNKIVQCFVVGEFFKRLLDNKSVFLRKYPHMYNCFQHFEIKKLD